MTNQNPYRQHLSNFEDLITPYESTRAGFIELALEKNIKASPFIEEAKALRILALKAKTPRDLLLIGAIKKSLFTAAGLSDKALNHLTDENKTAAVLNLIEKFLEPAGANFVDELVYRFLLTRGDALGGMMRNLAGNLGEKKFSRALISTMSLADIEYFWLHSKTKKWVKMSIDDSEIESNFKGISWKNGSAYRTLIYNIKVPVVNKNVDLCVFNGIYTSFQEDNDIYKNSKMYLALGELKGGIDPAGADEHWKTANSAIKRIKDSFETINLFPSTFFVGAAIERSMAKEIYNKLTSGDLSNAANLTIDKQLISLCDWIINI